MSDSPLSHNPTITKEEHCFQQRSLFHSELLLLPVLILLLLLGLEGERWKSEAPALVRPSGPKACVLNRPKHHLEGEHLLPVRQRNLEDDHGVHPRIVDTHIPAGTQRMLLSEA